MRKLVSECKCNTLIARQTNDLTLVGTKAVCCSSLLLGGRNKALRKHGKMQHPRKCSILGVGQSNQRQNGDGIKLKKEEEEEEEGELEGRRGRG